MGEVTKVISPILWYEHLFATTFFMLSFWNGSTPAQDAFLLKYFSASQSLLLLVFRFQYKIFRLITFIPKIVHVYLFQDHPT